jgi:hypothetical protein
MDGVVPFILLVFPPKKRGFFYALGSNRFFVSPLRIAFFNRLDARSKFIITEQMFTVKARWQGMRNCGGLPCM